MSLLLVAALFLALPAGAQQSNAPVSAEQQAAQRASILAATQKADFKRSRQLLEVYRTLRAAGVTLTSAEAFEMGEYARYRGLPVEAVESYRLLNSNDPEYQQNKLLIANLQEQAAQDRESGIKQSVDAAKLRKADYIYALVAEALAGQGDDEQAVELYLIALSHNQSGEIDVEARAAEAAETYGRSIELYELEFKEHPCGWAGSAPHRLCPAELTLVQLNYGISLFRLKGVEEARTTWSAIVGSPSVEILAKAWIDIADRSAN